MSSDYKFDDTKFDSSLILRLKGTGDFCRVMFICDPGDDNLGAFFYPKHAWDGKTYPDCPRKKDDPVAMCPLCVKGVSRNFRVAITVYDIDTGSKRILDGFPSMWFGDLEDVLKEWPWETTWFKVTRKGDKSQTRRIITPLGKVEDEALLALVGMDKPFTRDEIAEKLRVPSGGNGGDSLVKGYICHDDGSVDVLTDDDAPPDEEF